MENKYVKIGNKKVGKGFPHYLIAEIGINHNGDICMAKELIKKAKDAGWDAVKFQKRTVELVYTSKELEKARKNPFGDTNGDLKRGLEFNYDQYKEIDRYCKEIDIDWFVSCWDVKSVDFISHFNPVAYKLASACLTDNELLMYHKKLNKPLILSTGMSNSLMIKNALDVLGRENVILMHSTSTYPSNLSELNLNAIPTLENEFEVPVGYSGHEVGVYSSYAAALLGACIIERHITLDRAMWGSDQAASLEESGFKRLSEDIRLIPVILGDGIKRIYDSEKPIIAKLRKNH
jgi:N-acetylneuraminate synthase